MAEVVNFLVIIGILYFFVFKKVFVNLDKRKSIIADGIKKSEEAEETLQNAHGEKGRIITEARSEANEKIKDAVEKGKEKQDVIVNEAKEKAIEIIENGKVLGEKKKDSIISEADREIAKLAILSAGKILSEK
jgi:F-type H+-transporting ATPase subunit b